MRIWTLHPRYLDRQGLLALWREGLLAQKVLRGMTRGYAHHPQLCRFRSHGDPLAMIAAYLQGVCAEARARGYRFDCTRIVALPCGDRVEESEGQILFEWAHLLEKLKERAPDLYRHHRAIRLPEPHPLFRIVPGARREWERG